MDQPETPILLPGATQRRSPNRDERPADGRIDLLVIHNISLPPGEFGGPWIDQLFLNRLKASAHPYFREIMGLRVSSHLLLRRDGAMIQYVPLELRAWHAGVSSYQGRSRCNDYSIGIELEGTDDRLYTDAQYDALAKASRWIMECFPAITPQRIVGHADIAPGRKTDPGPAFDWARYLGELNLDSSVDRFEQ